MSPLRQRSAADLEGFQPISVRRESLLCCANLTFPPFACVPFAPIVWERLFVLSGWISIDVYMLLMNKMSGAWEFTPEARSTICGKTGLVSCPESHRMGSPDLILSTRIKGHEVSDRLHD